MPLISFITQPFQFVVHALDRLRYRWKFATLATVLVAAAVLLLQQMYADYREQVAATEREIAGLALSQQALDLLVNFQLQRGIAYSSMLGGQPFAERLPVQTEAVRKDIAGIEALIAEEPTLGPLRANWRELRADLDRATATTIEGATARQSFGAHTEVVRKLLSWMLDIGDVSGLAADASPALYHLNLTQIRTLPEFIESVANLRGYASGQFLARGADHHLTFELTSRLVAVNIAETALHARIDRISEILPGGLSMRSPKIRELHETVRYIRNTARYGATLPSSAIDAIDFFEVATLAIDQATHIHRTDLYPQSRALLDARLADQRRALEHHLVAVGGVFMVIATLFAAMYVSIRRSCCSSTRGACTASTLARPTCGSSTSSTPAIQRCCGCGTSVSAATGRWGIGSAVKI